MTELSNEKIAMLEIEQERMSLGKFFNPEDLKLENLLSLFTFSSR